MIFIDWLVAAAVRPHYELEPGSEPRGGQGSRSQALTGRFWGSNWESGVQTACRPVLDLLSWSSPQPEEVVHRLQDNRPSITGLYHKNFVLSCQSLIFLQFGP